MVRRLAVVLLLLAQAGAARAQNAGLVTTRSTHSVAETVARFAHAVRAQGWVVFTEIDHAAAARSVGLTLPARIVIFFGNPAAGTAAMLDHPSLALDLPMRVLVWQDADGAVFITRSTGADVGTRVFARHGLTLPAQVLRENEAFFADLASTAAN